MPIRRPRISSIHSFLSEVPYASLRISVSRLPEILRQDSRPRRLRRGRNLVSALRQQKRRASLGLLRPHIQKERVKPASRSSHMHFDKFAFGSLQIDGSTYEHDVVIDRGEIRKRKKKPSKKFREQFGHTPLSVEESIPWKCRRLVVGTGAYGRLPVMKEVNLEAERRKIELLILPTTQAIGALKQDRD